MQSWHENQKTTPRKATQQEKQSQSSNESTAAEVVVQVRLLTGLLLTQLSFTAQLAALLEQVVQSSSATPVTAEAMSFALWGMVNLSTNTCDQLKTLLPTLRLLSLTTPSEGEVQFVCMKTDEFLDEIVEAFDLG